MGIKDRSPDGTNEPDQARQAERDEASRRGGPAQDGSVQAEKVRGQRRTDGVRGEFDDDWD
ncbi:hypothetical protein ABZ934_16670 [Streptomyces sp. NPDC046557]|uniref:hypothetical protein n=1 Tax=Streptomyces sp. NPDC046557 TaxID=3155372 RepID=UPI0033DFA9D1